MLNNTRLLVVGLSIVAFLGVTYHLQTSSSQNIRPVRDTADAAILSADDNAAAHVNPKDYLGRWRKPRNGLTDQQLAEIRQLEAIGYVSGSVEANGASGVTVHAIDEAFHGYNFYTSGDTPGAVLMDMSGTVLHRWTFPFDKAFPNATRADKTSNGAHHWRRAVLLPGGDVIVVYGGLGIIKIDRDSTLIWANSARAHHDAQVLPSGDILTLTRVSHIVPRVNKKAAIAEDYIVLLDQNGMEKASWSVLEAVERWTGTQIWNPKLQRKGDIFHTNALFQLQRNYTEAHPEFTKGRVLTSMRALNALALIDLETNAVVWTRTGRFRGQHDPRMVDNGRILFFDNNGRKGSSGVFEYDLMTEKNSWRYVGTDEHPFYSRFCGTVDRLPNGNTLVTESDNGRAFELTREKTIVWEFHNPARAGDNNEFIAALFEVERIPETYDLTWITATKP